MQRKLLILSFIEGAAVMAAELCGARLLAPIFGTSLFVWASVLAITLAALALGYFFGGYRAERSDKKTTTLFNILNGAALFILLMPLLNKYAIPFFSWLPFLPGVIVSSAGILFFPIFFLGAASPLFISIQSTDSNTAGKVSGYVYAISTVGGILATFLCGFYMIPELGLKTTMFIFGGILFISNIIVFKIIKPANFILFAGIVYIGASFGVMSPALLSLDGILGRLEVKDLINKKDTVRLLTINDITQTEMDLNTKSSVSEYMKLLDTLIPRRSTLGSALVLGLGGGLACNLLVKKNHEVEGVEFDKRIIVAAQNFFFLDKKVRTECADARYYLNKCTKKYDVILFDIFKAEEQPSHVLTLESLEKLKQNLNDSSMVFINWHGYLSGKEGEGTVILFSTLVKAGYFVGMCSNIRDEAYRNIVFVVGLKKIKIPYELEPPSAGNLINTDDHPLLEKYNSVANKNWRISYLNYYHSK